MTEGEANGSRVFQHGTPVGTTELLRNAARQAKLRGFDRFPIIDVDAHHFETESWRDIVELLDDEVLRHFALSGNYDNGAGVRAPDDGLIPRPRLRNVDVAGRIPRRLYRALEEGEEGQVRDVTLVRRAMEAMGIDCQIVFPTPLLHLGLHPNIEIQVALSKAYARWVVENLLPGDARIKTMLCLPLNDPEASVELIERYAGTSGVVGFMVTASRYIPIHANPYLKVYATLQEAGMPLGFHGAYSTDERAFQQMNKFISLHSLGFPFYLMEKMTNWIVNGLPERFPDLRVIWIEGGLAWVPFLMQRLDNEYLMRTSEAPLLRRLPSEYMREMYYTSQPMERPDDLSVLETTFRMIRAETQLLYSSDYPHWDFDLPSRIYDLPFLREKDKRNILGGNAAKVFNLPVDGAGEAAGGEEVAKAVTATAPGL